MIIMMMILLIILQLLVLFLLLLLLLPFLLLLGRATPRDRGPRARRRGTRDGQAGPGFPPRATYELNILSYHMLR